MRLFFFVFLFYFISFSQVDFQSTEKNSEEKYKTFIDKCFFFINRNQDSLIYYTKTLKNSNKKYYRYSAYSFEAKSAYLNKDYDKSESLCIKALNEIGEIQDENLINIKISLYTRLFWIKKRLGMYNEAYQILTKQKEILKNYANEGLFFERKSIGIQNNLALVKSELGFYNETISILKKSLPSINELIKAKNTDIDHYRFSKLKANVLNSIGNTYLSLNKNEQNNVYLDSASYYYDNSYKISKNFSPRHHDSEVIYSLKKSEVLIVKNEYKKALKLIDKSNIVKDSNHFINECFQKALCFYHLKKSDSTIYYGTNFLNNKQKFTERNKTIIIYDILSKEYHNLRKIDSAYKYSKLTIQYYDLTKKNKEKTFQYLYENDFEKVKELNKIIKQEKSKKQIYVIVFSFILITFFLIFLYVKTKNKKINKQLITHNNLNNNGVKQTVEKKVTIKKEYNISKGLEIEILNEIARIKKDNLYLRSDFSINHIAESIKTNATYVSFVFNNHYNESFKQYYTKLRINYAVNKLNNCTVFKKYAIQAIAEEVGYTNASAFTRAFKKQTGETPSVFIKNLNC